MNSIKIIFVIINIGLIVSCKENPININTIPINDDRMDNFKCDSVIITKYGDVYLWPDTLPSFNNNSLFLTNNFNDSIKIDNNKKLYIYVSLIVLKNGDIKDMKILKGGNKSINPEIIRIFKLMGKCEPGMKNGHTVNVKFNVRVLFTPPAKLTM